MGDKVVEELFDGILEDTPEYEEDFEEPENDGDPDPEPVGEPETEPEPEVEPEANADELAPEVEQPDSELAADVTGELAPDANANEPDLEKQNAGLRREIQKLRQAQRLAPPVPQVPIAPQAPQVVPQAPPLPSQTTAPQHAAPVPVMMSDDGQNVYVDPSALDALVSQRIHQSQQPTPQQITMQRNAEAVQSFIAEDPANRGVVDRAKQADDYISLNIEQALSQGFQFNSVAGVIQHLEASGVAKKIAESIPEVGSSVSFAEFVAGMGCGDPIIRNALLGRMRPAGTPAPGVPVVNLGDPNALQSVQGGPKSMTRKGGQREQAPSGDKAEFDALEQRFQADPVFGLNDKEFSSMKSLGRKLGVDGWAA